MTRIEQAGVEIRLIRERLDWIGDVEIGWPNLTEVLLELRTIVNCANKAIIRLDSERAERNKNAKP